MHRLAYCIVEQSTHFTSMFACCRGAACHICYLFLKLVVSNCNVQQQNIGCIIGLNQCKYSGWISVRIT